MSPEWDDSCRASEDSVGTWKHVSAGTWVRLTLGTSAAPGLRMLLLLSLSLENGNIGRFANRPLRGTCFSPRSVSFWSSLSD